MKAQRIKICTVQLKEGLRGKYLTLNAYIEKKRKF